MSRKSDRFQRLVDWGIGLVSPRRAVIRSHFRRMENDEEYREGVFTLLRARGYRSAKEDDNATPFSGQSRSADGETLLEAGKLRDRSRELHRDDSVASGLLDTFVREIIGTELRPQSAAKEKKDADNIESVWEDRRATLNPTELVPIGQWFRILANKLVEDGEAIVKRAISKAGEPVWFEIVESERLETPTDAQPRDSEGSIRKGVERDRDGKIVAYWVMKRHPGDVIPGSGSVQKFTSQTALQKRNFTRVGVDSLRHVKLADRPGQSRGIALLHAVLQDLRDLDLLILACLKRTQVAACFALFIKSEQKVPDLLALTAENYGYRLKQNIVPGMIFKLFPNESIQEVIPNFSAPDLAPFVVLLARRIGAAVGVSWQTVLRDWSESTYSSARTQILADSPTMQILRHDLKEGILDWLWSSVMEDAALRGDERLAGLDAATLKLVKWIANGRPWIDPLKEAQATELKLKLRITTRRDVCGELGTDWEEQLEQSILEEKRENELRVKHNTPRREDVEAEAEKLAAKDEDERDAEEQPRRTAPLVRRAA